MADRINALPHGMALEISYQEINDLPALPLWAFMTDITMGFERVKEYVLGSSHPDLWSFIRNRDGSITAYRKIQKAIDRPVKKVIV